MNTISGVDSYYTIAENYPDQFESVFMQMYEYYRQSTFWDIELIISNNSFLTHKLVLITNSLYLKTILTNSTTKRTVEVDDIVEKETVEFILQFFYTGNIRDMQIKDAGAVLAFAKFLRAFDVMHFCFKFLENEMSLENVLHIHELAKEHDNRKLLRLAIKFELDNFTKINAFDGFSGLTFEHMKALMSSNDANVETEKTMFEALISWWRGDSNERNNNFCVLMNLIRCQFLPIEYYKTVMVPAHDTCVICLDSLHTNLLWYATCNMTPNAMPIDTIPRNNHSILLTVYGNKIKKSFVYSNLWFSHVRKKFANTYSSVPVLFGDKLLSFGGEADDDNAITDEVQCTSVKTGKQIEWPIMIAQRRNAAAVVLNGKLYVCGGFNRGPDIVQRTVEEWNPVNKSWEIGSLMVCHRVDHAITVCNDKIYVFGGIACSSAEVFDPNIDSWNLLPQMRVVRNNPTVAVVENDIYVLGGNNIAAQYSAERFNTKSKVWMTIASLPEPISGARAIVVRNKVICFCEERNYIYNDRNNTWNEYTNIATIMRPATILRTTYKTVKESLLG